jgi:hypothetical protein
MHGELHIAAYPFHGYWEDVGSLKDYYAANMAMAADVSGAKWHQMGYLLLFVKSTGRMAEYMWVAAASGASHCSTRAPDAVGSKDIAHACSSYHN